MKTIIMKPEPSLLARWDAVCARLAALEAASNRVRPSEASLKQRYDAIELRIRSLCAQAGIAEDELPAPPATSTSGSTAAQSPQPVSGPRSVTPGASPTQQRLERELIDLGFTDFKFVRAPGDYYDRELEYRQGILGAASIDHLCKSIIMENTRIHPSAADEADPLAPKNWADPCNSRYYIIVVQYTARLHAEKLKTFIHRLNEGRVAKQYFNMRLAPESVNDALSGYEHNAVSPIAIRTRLPMVVSHQITHLRPDFFWLGGGEVDLKVGLHAHEFVDKYSKLQQVFVADITY